MTDALMAIESPQPLRVRLSRVSVRAPNTVRPHGTLRVLIASSPVLSALNDAVREALGEEEQAFSGHITLARLGEDGHVPDGYTQDFLAQFGQLDQRAFQGAPATIC